MTTTTVFQSSTEPTLYALHPHKKVTLYFLVTGLLALLLGALVGPFQAFNYAGIDIYKMLPFLKSYYQGLTLHGVLNALVFTTYFITGLLFYLPARELGVRPNLTVAWGSYFTMTLGVVLAAIAILSNQASVLYTFYPPLQGSPLFYIGAALLVAPTLVVGLHIVLIWAKWKKDNPGKLTPIVTYMSVATWLMWFVASLGLVVEVVFMLIPWSLGWVSGVNPLLARTLFWYTGHPIVYFWLLPAYISWYALLPKQAGGKIISEPLARLAFALFLLISTPVGLHHQFTDPGIPNSWKIIHMFLTFMVAIPSLLTAFSVGASLEYAARLRGGRGWMSWIQHLPWNQPSFTAQTLAMVSFIFGGAGGIVNASMALDSVVHNTAWIPGHFHITVGTATTLTFFGISFWLIPNLTGKALASPKMALWSAWLWFWGMMVFAVGMHWEGLLGIPRRSEISAVTGPLAAVYQKASIPMAITGISGVILLVATILYFWVVFKTLASSKRKVQEEPIPWSESLSSGHISRSMKLLDRLGVLFAFALLLVVLAYGPVIWDMVSHPVSFPGQQLW